MAAIGVISFVRLNADEEPTGTAPARPKRLPLGDGLTSLLELPDRVAQLEGPARARARRLLDVHAVHGRTEPPPELEPWLERVFGSTEAVRSQRIVKVTNLATLEATLFAPLRRRRPIDEAHDASTNLARETAAVADDPFCHPETATPRDTFGRVRGRRVVTGANAALADAHHAVLVFDEHDPLAFDADLVADVFATGRAWAERAHDSDPASANYLLIWNCLWRAGGSIVHGHAQALLGPGLGYAAPARFRRSAAAYAGTHGSPLTTDLVAAHEDLGLAHAHSEQVAILAHLTPIKEHEVVVVGAEGMDEREPAFANAVAHALLALRDGLGVRSFNLALWRPPLGGAQETGELPPIVRIVDRGDPFVRASDIGAMELYGTPVVGSDPYDIAAVLAP